MATPPFSVTGLDHVVLRSTDVPKMLAFYKDVLGCDVAKKNDSFGLWHLRVGDSLIDILDVNSTMGKAGGLPPGVEGRNVDHIALKIRPYDEAAILEHLASYNVEAKPAAKLYGAEGTGPAIRIRDPEGNGLELKGPASSTEGLQKPCPEF